MSVRYRMEMAGATRIGATRQALTADDWSRAALDAIAAGGVDLVTVEGLARRLGVTKGSFYWHFADRPALVAAALVLWERRATEAVIAHLDTIADPGARLRRLFEISIGDEENGPVDAALAARVDDPVVAPVVRRVSERRIAYVERTLRDLGHVPAEAARRARVLYCTYLGHFQVRRALPDDPVLAGPSAAYITTLVETLAGGGGRVERTVRR